MRTGVANLPLHGGKCPAWLFARMRRMSRALLEVMLADGPPESVLERLADPFWFQALGCALGFDWHSSGLTTTVCGALKEALADIRGGLFAAGGKGRTSRQTPQEIATLSEQNRLALDPALLVHASRMAAKVDSAAVQDGYQIYHHSFFFTAGGQWAVIQQGMNETSGWARRYHWLSTTMPDFVCEPHHAVCSQGRAAALNLVAGEGEPARRVISELSRQPPDRLVRELKTIQEKTLSLPARHSLSPCDLHPDSLAKVLEKSYLAQPPDFARLLATPGVGAKALRALALLSELAYGTPPSYRDPARYSFAHGGKDGFPYPVDRPTYDASIAFLQDAVNRAKMGNQEKLDAFRNLARRQQPGRSG